MEKIKLLITGFVLLVLANRILAQTAINKDTLYNNRAYLKAGIEPATMLTLGYQHNINVPLLKHHLTTFAEWKVSIPRFSFNNSELKIGGIYPVFKKSGFMIVNNLNLSTGSVATLHFDSKKFAVADEIAIGFYKKRWFFATTIEYEKIFLNYLKHTDFYRETFYEGAKDGWYTGAGGMFQFGIEAGISLKERYDIHLEIMMPFTEKFDAYGGSPLHTNLGLAYRF